MEDETSVLERILNGDEDPKDLPLALLQRITNDFSQERKIGQGGFGAVYKGVLRNGVTVAVKRIDVNLITIDDVSFRREINSLMKINHQNVVRFLGFCSNTHRTPIQKAGSSAVDLVNVRERLLCLEYISNGSLDKHITDELRGLEWEPRYDIISGVCKALFHLHEEKKIVHMDLKPPNILLDDHMVPKITDFGLSRSNEMSHTMGQRFGTPGYVAPEYEKDGKTSFKCDVYSLGVIITELVTGRKSAPHKNNVLRRWRHRWNKPPTLLQYQQVTRCIDIAVRCKQQESGHRPSILEIVNIMGESESTDGHTGQESTYLDDDMLCIEPLELKLNEEMSWSVKITNKTKACFAFNIERPNQQYTIWPDKGIVTPGCNERLVQITLLPQQRAPQVTQNADKFILQSTKVPEGLRDEDITENIFHEEAGKVVDEVDLMVVYEPTKPQENCKSREDTNMPAEEVPEAKKRKIAESTSGKGKLVSSENAEASLVRYKGSNSSTRGHCTEQTEQCKFYPPQSFSRHYPTNTTYLGKRSRAVDVASGAMGSLLDKLGKLVKGNYNLERSMKRDIESFSEDLAKIHIELPNLGKLDGVEIWVDEVRELSYNIEDMVDSFMVRVEPDSSRSGFRELPHEGLKFLENDMTTHRQIGDVIKDIKNQVQAMVDRKKKYNFDVNNVVATATAKAPIDPRMAICINEEQLIGIEERIDQLIRLFEEDGDVSKQELKIVSIVGLGGLGKTTLAKAVYDKIKARYHSIAFVPVGQNPDVKKVLMNILIAVGNNFNASNLEEWQLEEKLKKILEDKRYLIVIDDIWDSSSWDLIASAIPRNNHGSRVITTTRIERVGRACCKNESKYVYRMKPLSEEDSRRLFFRSIFGPQKDRLDTTRKEEISKYILKKCGGMPLAINSLASLLGEEESTWEYIWKSLASVTEGNDLEKMKQILDLSYMHLPGDLKTCLLYVCMYPEDREIYKDDLLRLWVAEGFVSANSGPDAEDVANKYFNDLISMSMIQPGERDAYNNEVLSCRVHDIMLDLLRSKSSEENFIRVIDGSKYGTGKIRRVSFHNNDKNYMRIFETINKESLSQVRSVLLCRSSLAAYFLEKFKYVRVLHLERDNGSNSLDLTGISKLFLLRYLKIACPHGGLCELKLPNQIGELQQLETIDIQGCYMKKYPSDIVSLPWLSHLSMTRIIAGVVLPDGIDRLTSLRTLAGVRLYESSVDSILGLGKLTNLRKLEICLYTGRGEAITARHMDALRSSISILSTSLMICTFKERFPLKYVLGWSSRTLFPGDSQIRELHLGGCIFRRCPKCIRQLHKLYKFNIWVREVADGISIVAGLRSLAYFSLMTCNTWAEEKGELVWEEGKEERVVIPGTGSGAFQALKEFIFCCKNASLTFEAGAMPKLERLEIEFRYHMTAQFLPVDIQHLPAPTVKQICLRVAHNDMQVEGSQDWNSDDRFNYYLSDEYEENLRQHNRTVRALLMGAFKPHYPGADIVIQFEEGFDEEEDDENEDFEGVEDDEDDEEDEDDEDEEEDDEEDEDDEDDEEDDEDDEEDEDVEDDEEDEDDEDEKEDDEEDEDDEDDEEDDGKGVGDEEYCWEQKLVQHCRPVDVEDPVDAARLAALEVELSKLLQNNEDVEAISTNSPS